MTENRNRRGGKSFRQNEPSKGSEYDKAPELFTPQRDRQAEKEPEKEAKPQQHPSSAAMDLYRQRLAERREETKARMGPAIRFDDEPFQQGQLGQQGQNSRQTSSERPYGPSKIEEQWTQPMPEPTPQEKAEAERKRRARDAKVAAQRYESLQRRQNRRRTFTVAIIVIAAILLTLLLIRTLTSHTKAKPKLGIVQMGSVGDRYDAKGLIVREETVAKARNSGTFEPQVPEGQRVSKNTPVALVLNKLDNSTFKAIRDLDRRIADRRLTVMNERNLGGAEQLYEAGDLAMRDQINALRMATQEGRLVEATTLQEAIETIMAERNNELASIAFGDPVLADLESEKRLFEIQISEGASMIRAPAAGLVSYRPDNLAGELTPESLEELDFQSFKEWMKKAETLRLVPETMEKGDPAISIYTGSDHYLILQIDGIKSTDIPEGVPVGVQLKDDAVVLEKCRLERMTPNEEGVMLVVSTNREQERLLGKRKVEASLLLNSEEGLKVPSASLVSGDDASTGIANLYLVTGGFVETEPVRVLMQDREYALIEPLLEESIIRPGTIIIENPDSVEEGDPIG